MSSCRATNAKRRLTLELEVGDAGDGECGTCPFRSLDWEGGVPSGRYFCSCPAWEPAEVTAGRHSACIEAGEDHEGTSRLSRAIGLLTRIERYARQDRDARRRDLERARDGLRSVGRGWRPLEEALDEARALIAAEGAEAGDGSGC